MWKVFSAEEIVDFAVQIEENGARFYKLLAKRADNEKTARLLSFLAEEEYRHIEGFKNMLGKLQEKPLRESYQGEYENYVRALAESHVFRKDIDVEELIEGLKDESDILNIALRFEKDSILFFQEMIALVSAGNAETVKELIEQEKEHIRKLTKAKQEL